jgi:FKBP-type peptidyl-prolyl cis-trans isomerase
MKIKLLFILIAGTLVFGSCENSTSSSKSSIRTGDGALQSMEDSVNYVLGMSISQQFSYYNEGDYRPEIIELAMNDFISGNEFRVDEVQKNELLQEYFRWANANKNDSLMRGSIRFLKANGKKDNVTIAGRGLQYTYIKQGPVGGVVPDGNDVVLISYVQGSEQRGQLWDQTMATNTRDTISIALNRELTGFSQACQLMKEGDKIKAWLPPKIGSAEGMDPASVAIKNELIWMEIELLKVEARSHAILSEGELAAYPGYFINESQRFR